MRSLGALRAASALIIAVVVVTVALVLLLGGGSPAPLHPGNPVSLLEDNIALYRPGPTLQTLRSLGVDAVRIDVGWSTIAPDPSSPTPPPRFHGADPAHYPAANWAQYDAVVRDAAADGIEVDFAMTGPAPRWALPARVPSGSFIGAWEPSATAFGQFMHAFAARYSGSYVPKNASSPLPRVHFWEIWNEPNWGPSLEPQLALDPIRVVSASLYRGLLDAAWSALGQSGHGDDTIVIGNLSPRGVAVPPSTRLAAALAVSSPTQFTQTVYCVNSGDQPLRGAAAVRASCPTTAAGSRRFRLAHPALFEAAGFGVHPYPIGLPPTKSDGGPGTVEFNHVPRFASMLDRVYELYGSNRQVPIYNTEFGYITRPPNSGKIYVTPSVAARYSNWAEYLTWRNSRIATTMQFLLFDPNPKPNVFGPGGFASGLIFYSGKLKPGFYAYRMPVFMPVHDASSGDSLEVWGCVRPAHYAYVDTHQPQYVQIQFRRDSGGTFHTVRTVRLSAASSCYFDVHQVFSSSGTVRTAWSYPRGDQRLADPVTLGQTTIYSRELGITMS